MFLLLYVYQKYDLADIVFQLIFCEIKIASNSLERHWFGFAMNPYHSDLWINLNNDRLRLRSGCVKRYKTFRWKMSRLPKKVGAIPLEICIVLSFNKRC